MQVAVLLTVHNRRHKTVSCLERLFDQKVPDEVAFKVFLVDDGCTDGTAQAISTLFPQVEIILGDGTLFWNQGMRLAWKIAAASGEWDSFLWLNDDTMLFNSALAVLLQTMERQVHMGGKRGIVVGACRDPNKLDRESITYGGLIRGRYVEPGAEAKPIERFNGNLALVSRDSFKELGNLSPHYRHSFGDIDYGIRAAKRGIPIWLAPGFLGECPRNPLPKWRDSNVSFMERWKAVRSNKGWTVNEIKQFSLVRGQRFWWLSLLRQAFMVCFPGYARSKEKYIPGNE